MPHKRGTPMPHKRGMPMHDSTCCKRPPTPSLSSPLILWHPAAAVQAQQVSPHAPHPTPHSALTCSTARYSPSSSTYSESVSGRSLTRASSSARSGNGCGTSSGLPERYLACHAHPASGMRRSRCRVRTHARTHAPADAASRETKRPIPLELGPRIGWCGPPDRVVAIPLAAD
eukprot:352010-Chlamydomonas_euryale.AAC.4